jgi:hypothetical protein
MLKEKAMFNSKNVSKMKNIKIMMMTLMMSLILLSCKKSEVKPNKPCNCGVVVSDPIVTDANGNIFYSLNIKNDCSGNIGTYYFTYDVWLNAHVGENFCVTNVSSWLPQGAITKINLNNKN